MERTQRVVYHMWTTQVTTGKSIDDTDTYTITLDTDCLFKQQATVIQYHITYETLSHSASSPLSSSLFLPSSSSVRFILLLMYHRFISTTLLHYSILSLSLFLSPRLALQLYRHWNTLTRLLLLFQLPLFLSPSLSHAQCRAMTLRTQMQQEFEQTQHLPSTNEMSVTHSFAPSNVHIHRGIQTLYLYQFVSTCTWALLIKSTLLSPSPLPHLSFAEWNLTLTMLILFLFISLSSMMRSFTREITHSQCALLSILFTVSLFLYFLHLRNDLFAFSCYALVRCSVHLPVIDNSNQFTHRLAKYSPGGAI